MTVREPYTQNFEVLPFHADCQGYLSIDALGRTLLNTADKHAGQKGYDLKTLIPEKLTWVLSRLTINIDRLPRMYETFYVQTWVENIYHTFTDRAFRLLDEEGKSLVEAQSTWALIDLESRKMVDLGAHHEGSFAQFTEEYQELCTIGKNKRFKISNPDTELIETIPYTSLDINGHLNSIAYLTHIQGLFPVSRYDEYSIERIEMTYSAESKAQSHLRFLAETNETESLIEIYHHPQTNAGPACRSRIIWKRKSNY